MTDTTKPSVPFFAQYVETQEFPPVRTDVKGGAGLDDLLGDGTQKHPSDSDESSCP